MALTYDEIKNKYEQETLDFHQISKWHELGFKGEGAKILNLEGLSSHGTKTLEMIKLVAPEADIDWCHLTFGTSGGKLTSFLATMKDGGYSLEKFKRVLKDVDIVTYSKGSSLGEELEQIFLDNCICLTSAGNDGTGGLTGAFHGRAIDVGAIYLRGSEVKKESYSSINCDFATLHGYYEGTSFASPILAGIIGLIIGRYGKFNQGEIVEILKDDRVNRDYGDIGFDERFGHGVPKLPESMDWLKESEVDDDMIIEGRYTVRYAHLDRILVSEGDMVNPTLPWKAATPIGVMGNTGLSTAAHLHIDVVKYWQFKLWKLLDMYNGNKTPSKQELDFFVSPYDDTLFKVNPVITTEYDEQEYADTYGVRHLGYDVVPENRKYTTKNFTMYWNRSFAGRVLKTGYDNAYGNYVLVGYDTLSV